MNYKGFSTTGKIKISDTLSENHELVIADLLNHLMTRRGERVMRPTFGSLLNDLLFELPPAELEQIAVSEIQRIIKYDPRIDLVDLGVNFDHDHHSFTAKIVIRFVEDDQVVTLLNTFDLNR